MNLFVCFLLLFLFSAVSKAYRSDEHAGSVCRDGCRNSCCIPDTDSRDLMEAKNKPKVNQENSKVCVKKNVSLDYLVINRRFRIQMNNV